MSRYKFSSLAAGALLLLAGCQSDEFTWNGREVDSDEVLVTFYKPDFDKSLLSTRGVDTSDEISDITLVITNEAGNALTACYTVDNLTGENWMKASGSTNIYALTLPSDVAKPGTWYFFANAKTQVRSAFIADETTGTLKTGINVENELKEIQYSEADQWEPSDGKSKKSVLFTEKIPVDAVTPGQPINGGVAAQLKHIYGKLNVKIQLTGKPNQKDYPLQVTGVALLQKRNLYNGKGDIIGTPDETPEYAKLVSDLVWTEPTTDQKYTGGPAGSTGALKAGSELVIRTFPLSNVLTTTHGIEGFTNQSVMLIVKGVYAKTDDAGNVLSYNNTQTRYYAVEVKDGIPANKEWNVTIHGVGSAGSTDLIAAIKNPSGISVTFEDENSDITSMVSDGENALAVTDTVKIDYDKQVSFKVRARAHSSKGTPGNPTVKTDDSGYLLMEYYNPDGTVATSLPGWLSLTSTALGAPEKEESGLQWYTINYTTNCKQNNGSEREFKIRFYFKHNPEYIYSDVLFIQKAKDNYSAVKDAFDVTLDISGAAANDNKSGIAYGSFMTGGCQGVQPTQNGDRIRNEGLHIPMPNDGNVTYTYTVKLQSTITGSYTLTKSANWPSNAKLTGEGWTGSEAAGTSKNGTAGTTTTWEITCTPGSGNSAYDYAVYRDALILKVGEAEYKLDLYHTGFFHKLSDSADYCYYEVFSTGEGGTGEHWLDRNLGATSAGVTASVGADLVTGSTDKWPLTDASCGEYLTMTQATAAMPAGWTIPGYGNFEALYAQPLFEVQAMNCANGQTFTAPYYRFSAKEKNSGNADVNGADYTIRSYFPCVQYYKGSTMSGTQKSGYYMTSTQTSGTYYRVAQFDGLNMIALNQSMGDDVKMPVRAVTEGTQKSSFARLIQCNVAGYTHVALYAINATGIKTWITTWPGEPVNPSVSTSYPSAADKNLLKVTKHYEKEVYYNYGSNLRVIFNTVDKNGKIVASNMVAEDGYKESSEPWLGSPSEDGLKTLRKERNGIRFYDGGTYTRQAGLSNTATGAQNGNWTQSYSPESTITLTFPRIVKDNKVYEYVELVTTEAPSNVRARSTRTGNTTRRFKATPITGTDNYQVVVKFRYGENENAPAVDDLIGKIYSHNFYSAADGGDPICADAVVWQDGSNKNGLRIDRQKSTNGELYATIWRSSAANPVPDAAPYGTVYFKKNANNIPSADNNGNVYIGFDTQDPNGGATRHQMTAVTVAGQDWYKYDKVPVDMTHFRVYSYTTGVSYCSNLYSSLKSDFEQYGRELYYELDTDHDWRLNRVDKPGYDYYIYGEIFDGNWKNSSKLQLQSGKYVLEDVTCNKAGGFGIRVVDEGEQYPENGDNQKMWYAAKESKDENVSDGSTVNVKNAGTNFKLQSTGTYTFTFDPKAMTLSATKKPAVITFSCHLVGSILGDSNDETMGASGSVFTLTDKTVQAGNFSIRLYTHTDGVSDGGKSYGLSETISAMPYSGTCTLNGGSFTLPAGTYSFTFNPSDKSLSVSGTIAPVPEKGTIYYKPCDTKIPETAGGNLYIRFSDSDPGENGSITKYQMSKVTIDGETWYKYDDAPLDKDHFRIYSREDDAKDYKTNDCSTLSYDLAANSNVVYYYLDTKDEWKVKLIKLTEPTLPNNNYRIYWKQANPNSSHANIDVFYAIYNFSGISSGSALSPTGAWKNGSIIYYYFDFVPSEDWSDVKFILMSTTGKWDDKIVSGDISANTASDFSDDRKCTVTLSQNNSGRLSWNVSNSAPSSKPARRVTTKRTANRRSR